MAELESPNLTLSDNPALASPRPGRRFRLSGWWNRLDRRTRLFDLAVALYWLGAVIGWLVGLGGEASAATLRLGLVSLSVIVYAVIAHLFVGRVLLQWIVLVFIGGVAVIAVLGTANVNLQAARLTGLNYQVYSLLHRFVPRFEVLTVHQNVLGSFLVAFLPLAVGFAVWGQSWPVRIWAGGCGLVIAGAILITASRGAFLGLAAMLFVLGLFLVGRWRRVTLGYGLFGLAALMAGLVALLLNGLSWLDNGLNRIEVWRSTLALWSDYPLTGAGLDQFENRIGAYATPYISGQTQPHAHNLFLQGLVEFGLPGLLAFVLLLGLTLRFGLAYFDLRRVEPTRRPLVAGTLAGLVALFVNGLVEYGGWGGKFAPAFLVLPALLVACRLSLPPLKWFAVPVAPRLRRGLVGVVAVILILLILPLGFINAATLGRGTTWAGPVYELAATLAPWNATPKRDLGQLARQKDDKATASWYFRAAVGRDGGDWLSLLPLANLSQEAGQHAQALTYWRAAQAHLLLTRQAQQELAHPQSGRADPEKLLLLSLEIAPDYPEAGQELISFYQRAGRTDEARTLLARLIARQPTAGLYEQAAALASTPRQAIELLNGAVRLDPTGHHYYWLLGQAYQSDNQTAQAENAFKRSLELRPDYQRSVRSLAGLYLQTKRANLAVELLDRFFAAGIYIERPDFEYLLLAQAHLAQGQLPEAFRAAQQATNLNPDSTLNWLTLGDIGLAQGDKPQAHQAYERALALDPGNQAARQGLAATS